MFDLYKDIYDAQINLLKSFNQGKEKNDKEKLSLEDYFREMARINEKMVDNIYDIPKKYMDEVTKFNPFKDNFSESMKGLFEVNPYFENFMNFQKFFADNLKDPKKVYIDFMNNFKNYFPMLSANGKFMEDYSSAAKELFNSYNKYQENYMNIFMPESMRERAKEIMNFNQKVFGNFNFMIPKFGNMPFMIEGFFGKIDYFKNMEKFSNQMLKNLEEYEKLFGDNNYFASTSGVIKFQKAFIEKSMKYFEVYINYYKDIYTEIAKISEFTFEKYRSDLEELALKKDPQEVYDFFEEKTKEQYKKLFDVDKFKEIYKKAEEDTKELREELFKINMDYMNFVEPSSKEDVKDLKEQITKMSNKIDSLNKEIERLKSE
ncbi:hypothetical protein HKO22_05510 [Peptoniphilus sp. AGMB00490]|uniref:Uncharacterized protein n=1 Tax=Peptoniphilus faecalis TaxID=2731255 RepID=A0A848RBK0_9FIRM|nr:hypothetical protein [Peptoniphilus faecalis]NMW85198.1 hypothetical protein [Peptoniphilus faecalis]